MKDVEMRERIEKAIEDAHQLGFTGLEAALRQLDRDFKGDLSQTPKLVKTDSEKSSCLHLVSSA